MLASALKPAVPYAVLKPTGFAYWLHASISCAKSITVYAETSGHVPESRV